MSRVRLDGQRLRDFGIREALGDQLGGMPLVDVEPAKRPGEGADTGGERDAQCGHIVDLVLRVPVLFAAADDQEANRASLGYADGDVDQGRPIALPVVVADGVDDRADSDRVALEQAAAREMTELHEDGLHGRLLLGFGVADHA